MGTLANKIRRRKTWLPITILLLVLINWLASIFHTRIDFTNEKRFTLSIPTKKLLKKVDDKIQIDVFLKGEFPSSFKKLANSTGEVLQEFKEIAGNKIQYNFISPEEEMPDANVTYGDSLSSMGLYAINLKSQLKAGEQKQLVYPFALVHYKETILPVNLYTGNKSLITPAELNNAEALMEFKFADAISKLTEPSKPMIAYSVGNGELGPNDIRTYDLFNYTLKKDYSVFTFNLNTQPAIPDTFKTLMIVKPTLAFTEEEKLKIDQFIMRGGRLLLFIDKLEAELDSLKSMSNQVIAYDRNIQLTDLLYRYGVRINSDLVMDLQCDFLPFVTNGKDQMDYLHWNYFPLFETKSNHVINKNLGLIAGQFVNSIDTVEAEGILKTILLSSSTNSKTIATPALISGAENINAPEDENFKKANIPVAVLLEGKFRSLFANRLSQAMKDSLAKYNIPFEDQSNINNKVIVVSDGDIVLNGVSKGEPIPMGMNRYTAGSQYQYEFANRDFLQNCLDYLINSSGLAEAKAKSYTLRLLDKKKTEEQKTLWQIINIVLPVLFVCLFGFIYQWRRKRKYTRN
jgi:ABC-2 type transport system permease protein